MVRGLREKVRVVLDDDLRALTLDSIRGLRAAAETRQRPPPLENSPKCPRCSLAGICLPDETNLFRKGYPPRPLNPSDDPALPLYVQTPRARLRKQGETLVVETQDDKVRVPMISVSQGALFGPVSVTTPALHALMRAGIPVSWFSTGGWFLGHTVGTGNGNVAVREAQYRAAFSDRRSLVFARSLVAAKIRNSRTMLRRNWRAERGLEGKADALAGLKRLARRVLHARDPQQLLGQEGEAAAIYFGGFQNMLATSGTDGLTEFSFTTRNRRPPTDPVNAMLSLAYAMLSRHLTVALAAVGLDPYRGLYHAPRHGRPALALDLMEPFRPVIGDSVVLTVVNTGVVSPADVVTGTTGTALTPAGRRRFVGAFERRLSQETTHPLFGYRLSMRRLLMMQARLLSRHFLGELRACPHYLPR